MACVGAAEPAEVWEHGPRVHWHPKLCRWARGVGVGGGDRGGRGARGRVRAVAAPPERKFYTPRSETPGAKILQCSPRCASESVFPSMIDTYFERPSPLTCVSFAPVTYVQTRQTSMFKGSLFGSHHDEYARALAARASTQTRPCRPRLVASLSTCPSLFPFPPAHSSAPGPPVINYLQPCGPATPRRAAPRGRGVTW